MMERRSPGSPSQLMATRSGCAAACRSTQVTDALSRPPGNQWARPSRGSHTAANGVDLGHDIFAVVHDRGAARRAQGHVQHRAVLGEVDLVASEHGVDTIAQSGLMGELEQQPKRFMGDAVLGIVEINSGSFCSHLLAAPRVLGKELAQV